MRRYSDAHCRRAAPVLLGVLALLLASCASTPELAPEEEPRLEVALPDTLSEDRAPSIAIDPRGLAGSVTGLRIEARPATAAAGEAPLASWERPPLRTELPLEGLEDGRRYRYRFVVLLERGQEYPLPEEPELTIDIGMGVPRPEPPELITIDRAQSVSWRAAGAWPGARLRWRSDPGEPWTERAAETDRYAPDGPWLLGPASSIAWQVRHVSRAGVLGPWSVAALLRYAPDEAVPRARNHHTGRPSVVALPGLTWHRIAGAVAYEVELGVTPDTEDATDAEGTTDDERTARAEPDADALENRARVESAQERLRLTAGLLETLLAGRSTREVYWRVRARAADGVTTPFSPLRHFNYRPLVGGLVPVVPPGASVSVRLGSATSPESDETPEAVVVLPRPFEMQRTELTAGALAAIIATELDAGRMRIAADGVRSAGNGEGRLYLGLGELTFGRQFTLEPDQGGGIAVRPGYAGHPAVGLSWYGALAVANALSLLEGRDPVYAGVGTPGLAVTVDVTRDGYRLPYEAEWAAAVSLGSRIEADTTRVVVEARPLSAAELRGSNYLRSNDRWEDPVAPFTREGGPTTPVGALGYANPSGLVDLIGNVWEWTGDWYDPGWYARIAAGSVPQDRASVGPDAPVPDIYGREQRSVRGLAWNSPRETLRPGNRGGFSPDATSHSIGVRLVRTIIGRAP